MKRAPTQPAGWILLTPRRISFLSLLVVILFSGSLAAQSDYKISSWTTDDGLPGNAVVRLYQDQQGYLWLGTFDGLVKYDGNAFTVFNKDKLTTNFTVAIAGDPGNQLWIGTDQGLLALHGEQIIDLRDKEHSFYIESLLYVPSDSMLWIGTRNAGLYTFHVGTRQYSLVPNIQKDDIVNDLLMDPQGNIFIATEKNGLVEHKPSGSWVTYDETLGLGTREIKSLSWDSSGFYIGTTQGLYKLRGDTTFHVVEGLEGIRINKVVTRRGDLWVGTVNGLYYKPNGDIARWMNRTDGLSNNDIRDILIDRHNTIWLGTYRGGLNQLRPTPFRTHFRNHTPPIEAVGALAQTPDGRLLVGTTEGALFTLEGTQPKEFKTRNRITQRIYSILRDKADNYWIASYDGLLLITPDGKEKLFTEKDGLATRQIRMVHEDRRGNYWLATRNAGLIKMTFTNPMFPEFHTHLSDSLAAVKSTFVMSLGEDAAGNLILCTNNGGFTILTKDGQIKNWNRESGLPSNTCFIARTDPEGFTWITSTTGLVRYKDGAIKVYTRKQGMPVENPMDVLLDAQGYFWMPTQRGIIRVSRRELNDYATDTTRQIQWRLFDRTNDLESSECTGTAQSLVTPDGRLYFPMIGSLIEVDPIRVLPNDAPPEVHLVRVSVNDQSVSDLSSISISNGNFRLVIDYTTLSLLYPQTSRFRYRLKNYDASWVEAGTARQAVFTNLPPGEYEFEVIASINNGPWNSIGAHLPIRVEPRFYQTWWFMLGSGMAAILFVILFTHYRTRAIKKQTVALEKMIRERTRQIASQNDELKNLNEELIGSQEEILAQRDALADKIDQLASRNLEIARINSQLEEIVRQRTSILLEQNRRIAEYAFINAHKLRAPLASILGLINLMSKSAPGEEQVVLHQHLLQSAEALDTIVRSINRMLEEEDKLKAGDIDAILKNEELS